MGITPVDTLGREEHVVGAIVLGIGRATSAGC